MINNFRNNKLHFSLPHMQTACTQEVQKTDSKNWYDYIKLYEYVFQQIDLPQAMITK